MRDGGVDDEAPERQEDDVGAEAHPLDDRAHYDLATVDRSLGEFLASTGDRRGARHAYQEALENITFMLKRDPDNATLKEHRQELEESLRDLDRTPAAQKRPPQKK